MFSHVMLGADDMETSKAFYDATMGALGYPPGKTDDKGRVAYRAPTGNLLLSKPIDGEPATCANGGTVGLAAKSTAEVEAWHKAGVDAGGTAVEDPPGVRGMGKMQLFLAYLRDPAGNKLCALYRMPD